VPKKTQPYDAWQMNRLSRPDAASSFLNAARAESLEMFLLALRKVAQAHQMARVAKEANVQRETLYRALSGEGNPTISTLSSVLEVLGLDFIVSPKKNSTTSDPTTKERAQRLSDLVDSAVSEKIGVVDIGAYKSLAGIGQYNQEVVSKRDLGRSHFAFDSRPFGARRDSLPQKDEQQQLEMVNAF
jgi:probable addiction module antidote protein